MTLNIPKERLLSLDVFRGVTVAAMILVNDPGSWDSVYSPLQHAKWDGCTPTDLIFPFFLFIVGVSISYALPNQLKKGKTKGQLMLKILKRGLIIFGLGLFLNTFPTFDMSTIRIPGVLQRIALVFVVCGFIFLNSNVRMQVYLTAFFLLFYWFLMTIVPVPGIGPANLEPATNLGAWLDNLLLNGHLWSNSKVWDPEGLLSTMPAFGTGLIGILTGTWIQSKNDATVKVIWMLVFGAALIVLGMFWGLVFPINKALWTSSYVLYTGGLALQGLAICYWLVDQQGYKSWIPPFVAFGINAITAYFVAGILAKLLFFFKVGSGEEAQSLWGFLYQNLFTSWLPPYNASLAWAICFVLVNFAVVWVMYKKKIIIKV